MSAGACSSHQRFSCQRERKRWKNWYTERGRKGGGRGRCNSEWTALHWQDEIRIDRLITASLSKQRREGGKIERGKKNEEVRVTEEGVKK